MITQAQLASVRAEWLAAPRGDRVGVLQRWATALGVSPATLYRRLNATGHRGTARPRAPSRPEYREWAMVLMELMARSPEGAIPLHLCLRAARLPDPRTGAVLLPEAAEQVPLSTYQRIIREELGARATKRRNRRMHADYPNQAWQLDATTSKYLIVDRELDDGDYALRLWRNPMPSSGYKNKPLKEHRLRLLYYGIWDMRTGYQFATPQIARGESGLDAMQALCEAMVQRDDPRDPLHGVPEDLWSDQGVLVKHAATADLLERLGINVVTGEAYAKERMGGIEQVWRRLWQSFEASLFLEAPARGVFELTLADLRARLREYFAEVNSRPSRALPSLSRRDCWVRESVQRGGACLCPDRPLETIAHEVRRWVDGAGVIRWDNQEYQVPDIHRCWVIARRALDGSGRVIVEEETTGKRWDCTLFTPLSYGERIRAEVLPIDQARRRAQAGDVQTGPLYAPSDAAAEPAPTPTPSAKVVGVGRFRGRSQPAATLIDRLDAEHYASLPQAMAALYSIIGVSLSPENHAACEQRLLADGLRKDAVHQLASLLSHALAGTTGA